MEQPDALERRIRFGCGSLLGLILGFAIALNWFVHGWGVFLLLLASHALICGWLATRYGDRFWHRIADWLWLWS
jgi:uncharacterized membrane protein YccC